MEKYSGFEKETAPPPKEAARIYALSRDTHIPRPEGGGRTPKRLFDQNSWALRRRDRQSAIMAMNSELVGLPLMLETV